MYVKEKTVKGWVWPYDQIPFYPFSAGLVSLGYVIIHLFFSILLYGCILIVFCKLLFSSRPEVWLPTL